MSSHVTDKRKRKRVETHYDEAQCPAPAETSKLRQANNAVKRFLLRHSNAKAPRILDLGGGKGGDFFKFKEIKARSVKLVDVSAEQIESAKARHKQGQHSFTLECVKASMHEFEAQGPLVDLINCQFALHYACDSEDTMVAVLDRVARALRPGGVFVGTVPDCKVLLPKMLRQFKTKLVKAELTELPAFGIEYEFSLEGSVQECPEFIVPFQRVVKLAEARGLKLRWWKNFLELGFHDHLDEEEREVFGLYGAFVFDKSPK